MKIYFLKKVGEKNGEERMEKRRSLKFYVERNRTLNIYLKINVRNERIEYNVLNKTFMSETLCNYEINTCKAEQNRCLRIMRCINTVCFGTLEKKQQQQLLKKGHHLMFYHSFI